MTTDELFFYRYKPQAGDIVLEVGAGTGTETVTLSEMVWTTGLVYAIEPHPFSYLELEKACAGRKNIKLIHAAATNHNGIVSISNDVNPERNRLVDRGGFGVDAIRLDDLELPRVDFLKMNIEGEEANALVGFWEGLKTTRNVVVACHDFLGMNTREAVRQLLVDSGFEVVSNPNAHEEWEFDYLYGTRA